MTGDTSPSDLIVALLRSRVRIDGIGDYVTPFDKALADAADMLSRQITAMPEDIAKIAAHCDKHERSGRAQFSIVGIRTLLDHIAALEAALEPFAANACGGDGEGFLSVPNGHAARFHDPRNPAKPTLVEGDFRRARDVLRAARLSSKGRIE